MSLINFLSNVTSAIPPFVQESIVSVLNTDLISRVNTVGGNVVKGGLVLAGAIGGCALLAKLASKRGLHSACQDCNIKAVRDYLKAGAKVNGIDYEGRTPLAAAFLGRKSQLATLDVAQILVANGADVNQANRRGEAPLHHVCFDKDLNIAAVSFLLSQGATVNQRDSQGRTPLYCACLRGHLELARLLIQAGADVNLADSKGRTPLRLLCSRNDYHWDRLVPLLIEAKARVDQGDSKGRTPLHLASYKGNYRTLQVLLKAGAYVDQADSGGRTPLHAACFARRDSEAQLLLKAGADVNKPDQSGNTPLHISCGAVDPALRNVICARLLYKEGGADPNATNQANETPTSLARRNPGFDPGFLNMHKLG